MSAVEFSKMNNLAAQKEGGNPNGNRGQLHHDESNLVLSGERSKTQGHIREGKYGVETMHGQRVRQNRKRDYQCGQIEQGRDNTATKSHLPYPRFLLQSGYFHVLGSDGGEHQK